MTINVNTFEKGMIRLDRGQYIDKGNNVISVLHPDYRGGAVGDGVYDDYEAFRLAEDDASALGIPLELAAGRTHYIGSDITISLLRVNSGKIKPGPGVTVTVNGHDITPDGQWVDGSVGGTVSFLWGGVVNAKEYSTLDLALAAIGATDAVLLMPPGVTYTLTANTTIPANVTLDMQGGVIVTNGFVLTLNSRIAAGYWQAFDTSGGGGGSVAFSGHTGIAHAEWFGALGNDTADDTVAWKAVLAAMNAGGPGGTVLCRPGATYQVTTDLPVTGVQIDLNKASLHFAFNGDYEGVRLRNNSSMCNGTVYVTGVTGGGSSGQFLVPVVIGDFLTNTGYSNIRASRLTVNTVRPSGVGVFVTADSHDVEIEGITLPSSTTLAIGCLIHWSGAGITPPTLTTHPYNITVRHLTAGVMTRDANDCALLFISAAHSIHAEHLYAEQFGGPTGPSLLHITAGDLGYEYASADQKALAMQDIVISGVVCPDSRGRAIMVDGRADNATGMPEYPIPAIITGVKVSGAGASAPLEGGVRVMYTADTYIEAEVSGFDHGATVEQGCKRIKLRGSYTGNQRHGVLVSGANMEDCDISVEARGNGADGTTNAAGVFVNTSVRTRVHGCVLGALTGTETQVWGVRVDSSATRAIVERNHCRSLKTGGNAYSLASSTDYESIERFRDNTDEAGETYRGGVTPVPVERRKLAAGTELVVMMGTAAPADGTWAIGSRVEYEVPTAGGSIGTVCTTAGTPGTWKTYGAITA